MTHKTNRRQFLKRSTLAIAAPIILPSATLGRAGHTAPSERVTIGSIGLGGQGTRDMQEFLRNDKCQILALCDVDSGSENYEQGWLRGLAPAKAEVEKYYAEKNSTTTHEGVQGYEDFRELLARDDIDAVHIGTPDHWHALIAIAAANVGKDMYCQKPLARTIPEGRAIVTAVQKNNRVFQCGSQRRSSTECRHACEAVRNEHIGKLTHVEAILPGGHNAVGYTMGTDPMPIPEGFNYDMWLGPTPQVPYTHKRCHFTFRWNLNYSGGQLTDWGAHFIDMAHWGMGVENTGPISIEGTGKFLPREELWNTAVQFDLMATYKNGVTLNIKSGENLGVTFHGTDGHVKLDGKVHRKDGNEDYKKSKKVKLYRSHHQHRNFIDCVLSREITSTPAEVAHRSITPAHLANIALMTGRKLNWNPKKEQFINDDEANALLQYPYRAPWVL